ncbi:MAG: regulatory protein RecX [Gammaproteobacteria bacterium]|jgi:regulatory protein|nr:regulatory protein RecX [Gammaproteobacteria bacterium]
MSFTGRNRKDITGDGAEKKSADKTPPVKDRALGLLARREHSAVELKRKLQQKGYNSSDIDTELLQLQRDGSLSDRRFTEAYVNMRMNRGYGPMRILAELRDRGIPAELANEYLNQELLDWHAVLSRQYTKKYAGIPIADHQDKSKRIAYLQARGFRLDLIFEVLS